MSPSTPGGTSFPVVVDHGDVVPGGRPSHRAWSDRALGGVRDQQRVLGLPVAVVDRQPSASLEPRDHLGVERLARGDGVAERGRDVRGEAVQLRHQAVLGRRLAEDGDAEPLEQLQPLCRRRSHPRAGRPRPHATRVRGGRSRSTSPSRCRPCTRRGRRRARPASARPACASRTCRRACASTPFGSFVVPDV